MYLHGGGWLRGIEASNVLMVNLNFDLLSKILDEFRWDKELKSEIGFRVK